MPASSAEFIRLRGVRQNNLRGFDLDLPLGKFIVVTGLSGAGKSSLVFDTLHAEGQRRYVETFSAYTRQFLELLDKPAVDLIENIRPSIAIAQTNTVKTSRSTVGTMTELTDYAKVWFSHVAACFDPETGEPVEDDNPATIWTKVLGRHPAATLLLAFRVDRPANLEWAEILKNLAGQGYARILIPHSRGDTSAGDIEKIEDLVALKSAALKSRIGSTSRIFVIQDRVAITAENKARFLEATETALHFGKGEIHIFAAGEAGSWGQVGHFSRGLHSPKTGRTFRAATPGLFSFNSPLGACPKCRGFGRVIEIDYRLAIPDQSLSIDDGAIRAWEGEVYSESKKDLLVFTRKRGIPTHIPFAQLTPEHKAFIIDGEPGYGTEGKRWPKYWYGLKGFFNWLEKTTYKMHVRVFLSRYRSYNPCPDCHGARLQPEALCWKWQGRTLPEFYQLPISELLALIRQGDPTATPSGHSGSIHQRDLARDAMVTRLRYLEQVGLGYLTLDRSSRSLSGGEVQRVNLTSCLGTSLVDTLFVLDEPSVGLHPRDIDRLIGIIRTLTDAGNTVVVVEHDEAMIRAADHVLEVGPGPGAEGGQIVFQGDVPALLRTSESLTGRYLSGRARIEVPERRRPVDNDRGTVRWLRFTEATKHNVNRLSFQLPLERFVCLSGVSGSGKSTLLDNVIHQGLLTLRNQLTEDPATIRKIAGADLFGEVVLVDQSPLSRTPRSNPALYCEAWELIRELYADTPAAQEAGFTASSFSFNGGDGRCDHCQGLGSERVEMQFLSDVFVPCPICEGKRFKPEILAIRWQGKSVADLLQTTVTAAMALFENEPAIRRRLAPLEEVGLGYLALGQPLNTLSGGESQRLKLVRYLGDLASGDSESAANEKALLLIDEPTTGLHRHDVGRLLRVLQRIVDRGHSLVVIEHNLDVLKSADWILEIGPGAGAEGGRVIAEGTPEAIAATATSTAPFLQRALSDESAALSVAAEPAANYDSSSKGSNGRHELRLVGARENNLKDLSLTLPHRMLSVVTGVSGSGKSTLAFDIIFAEGQRRFMESMSPYARQFVEQLPRPDIDLLSGIPPTVAIEQRVTRGSRKSTVATITEIAQYLRLLYARLGVQFHPESGREVTPLSPGQLRKLLDRILATPAARRAKHLYLCAPLIRGRKGHHEPMAKWIGKQGYELMRADGRLQRVDTFQKLDRYKEHDIEVVVADLKSEGGGRRSEIGGRKSEVRGQQSEVGGQKSETGGSAIAKSIGRLPTSDIRSPASALRPPTSDIRLLSSLLDRALALGKGSCFVATPDGKILSWLSTTRTDIISGESFPELDPKQFSFNSPKGWCPTCRGHGRIFDWMLEPDEDEERSEEVADALRTFDPDDPSTNGKVCPTCHGERLSRIARSVRLPRKDDDPISLPELLRHTSGELLRILRTLKLDARGQLIVRDIIPQIEERLRFLSHVGLDYLSADRPTETLSGGEAQRIRLAAQLGSNLSGVLYVLDEPSIGLHARDNDRLIDTLESLRAKGNTLLVVEHDDVVMERADRIVDLGPGAGVNGGHVLANDTPANLKKNERSLTGLYLGKGIPHPLRGSYRDLPKDKALPPWLELSGIHFRNLTELTLRLPPARLIVVCGPSGAGKSTLFRDILHPAVTCAIKRRKKSLTGSEFVRHGGWTDDTMSESDRKPRPPFARLTGAAEFRSVIEVDQAPIGKTPRSTPATYLGIFDLIRQFFATLPESRLRGFGPGRFSFNTPGGRCETCAGAGRIKLEMAFMPDSYLPCENCGGSRYGPEVADLTWKGRTIGDVLKMSFDEAVAFFDFHSQLKEVCQLMVDCGLGYLTLGQSSPSLSGGEAQRLKLVTELARGLQSYMERSRGLQPRNLYLLEEPTIGLHLSDCEKLIKVLHRLVDQGHTVVVIEHHLDVLAEADYLIELGPGGGPHGGKIIYQGALPGLLKVKGSPTAPYLRAKLKVRTAHSANG
ncbi:MAG TPA: excinuclease ABC subunit UvrA [Candidatus Didemnitutus sp.]|nr:excinuclease ABC subunit UvrA [Candidatus Didemnitutus sp.]